MGLVHERLQHMISANLCMLRCTCVQTASSASLQLGLVTFTIYMKIMHSLLTGKGKEMYSFFGLCIPCLPKYTATPWSRP